MFNTFIEKLTTQLQVPLPGLEAQLRMAPPFRRTIDPTKQPGYDPKVSAVLVLLYPVKEKIMTVLILRPAYEGVHSGQVGFPGGKLELNEEPVQAALRETEEEIGVKETFVKVIGRLTELYIPPSNFLVHPFVAFSSERPDFILDKNEVEQIIEVSMDELLDDSLMKSIQVRSSTRPGEPRMLREVPCYEIQGHNVWGATAMMMNELKEILRKSK